jgi:hypothetical protein
VTWREYIAILKKQSKLTIFRIVILAVAGWSAFIGLSLLCAYDTVYLTYPRTPDPETRRIVPYAFKNTVRYVTKEQMNTLHWLDWTHIILAVFIAINLLFNVKWPLPSKWDS